MQVTEGNGLKAGSVGSWASLRRDAGKGEAGPWTREGKEERKGMDRADGREKGRPKVNRSISRFFRGVLNWKLKGFQSSNF